MKWRFRTDDLVHGSPLIGEDGTIYVLAGDTSHRSQDPIVYAISPPATGTTGVLKWRFVLPPGAEFDIPAASLALGPDGTVYVATDKLYAVGPPSTGTEGVIKWSYRVPRSKVDSSEWFWPLGAPTIGADGTIYIIGSQLCALSPVPNGKDGVLKWSFGPLSSPWTPPAIAADGTIYALNSEGSLVGISPPTSGRNGSLRWSFPAQYDGWPSVVADDGIVFGDGGDDDRMVAVSPPAAGREGKVAWTYSTGCPRGYVTRQSAIGADGTLYVGCIDGDLLALTKPETGDRGVLRWRWVHHGGHGFLSWPAVGADGTVFFGANDGNVYAVSPPQTGTVAVEKWAFQTQGPVDSSPAIGPDGTIYVCTADRYLYAIE